MKKLLALSVVLLTVIGAAAAGHRYVYDPGGRSGRPVTVVIPPGSAGSEIAQQLEEEGVISSAVAFRIFLKVAGANDDLKAGEYRLREDMAFVQLLDLLRQGPAVEYVKLVIPEGLNLEQIAGAVEKGTHITAAEFLAAATPANIRPSILPEQTQTLEGFLYPATYFVTKKEDALSLAKKMVAEFEKRAAEAGLLQATGRTPYEYVTIASMVEEEAKAEEERELISAVIHNRLNRGIPLGIDATIQYAVKKYKGEPLTRSDLEIDSPYNSRTRTGLPPTPIASPRLSSLKAALNPAPVDYLYYVLREDCIHHLFTADYAEFERAKQRMPRDC